MDGAKQFGQLLTVDLNSHQCRLSPLPDPAMRFLGGRGVNLWYLYQHLPPDIDPLSSENIMIISCGLLTGSSAPAGARLHINALSPLTGILGSSNIGGYTGAWLRTLDIATIVIRGRSQNPVYLDIRPDGVSLKDAAHLWGCDAFETQEQIKKGYADQKSRVLTIGPGGENLVRFAAVISERDHAAGRTGMGAVMGSKHLKAIVVSKGDHQHLKATRPEQRRAVDAYTTAMRASGEFKVFSRYGGAGYVGWANEFGIMGSRNYSRVGVDDPDKIDGRILQKHVVRPGGCYGCPIQCKADLKLDPSDEKTHTRPEFEPMINLGPKCGLEDVDSVVKLDNLCTRLGLDSTSAATVMAFAMEVNAHGLMPEDLSKGLDLSWGNAQTMETLLHQMVDNKGLGSILRLGVRQAAQEIGKGTSRFAAHVKGLELTAYHPGAIMGTALGYAVSSRGGDYNNVYASLEHSWTEQEAEQTFETKDAVNIKSTRAKGALIRRAVVCNIIVDCLGLCKVPVLSLLRSFNLDNEARLINGLAGDITPILAAGSVTSKDLFEIGHQVADMEKLFNIRHAKEDLKDMLPDRFFTNGTVNGLTREKFETMLKEFYEAMGWDENGIPPEPAQC